jgi:hypothetical protein
MKKLLFLSISLLVLTKVSAQQSCPKLTLQNVTYPECQYIGIIHLNIEGLPDGVYNDTFYYDQFDGKAIAFKDVNIISGKIEIVADAGEYRNIRYGQGTECENVGDVQINIYIPLPRFQLPIFCSLENKTLKDVVVLGSEVVWFKENDLNTPIEDLNIPLVEGGKYSFKSGCLLVPYTVEVESVAKPILSADCTLGAGKAKISITNPVQGYTYSLDGGAFQKMTEFMEVSNGSHYVTARSENDCTAQSDVISFYCDPIEPIVYIPNATFKWILVNNLEINTNNDSEIQVSEALKVTKLELGSCEGYLEGLLAFENLEELTINSWNNGCEVDEPMIALKGSVESYKVDLSKLKKLTYLNCGYGGCDRISIENSLSLKKLYFEKDYLRVKGCDNLESIVTNWNYYYEDYDFSYLPNLKEIRIYEGRIKSINLIGSNNIETFIIDNITGLKDLDFRGYKKLKEVAIIGVGANYQILLGSNESLTKFSLGMYSVETLDFSEASNLKTLSIGSAYIENLNIKNGSLFTVELNEENHYEEGLDLEYASDLKSICVDEGEYEFVKSLVEKYGYKPIITTDCANLSVSENEWNVLNITLSPNPTQGKITLTENVDEVKVFDLSGRLVKSTIANTTEVDLSDLQNGVYIMQVNQGQKTFTTKVVKE